MEMKLLKWEDLVRKIYSRTRASAISQVKSSLLPPVMMEINDKQEMSTKTRDKKNQQHTVHFRIT